jgi:hypothetical protein
MATDMIRLHICETGEDVLYPRGVRLESLAKDYAQFHKSRIMAARVNNDIRELSTCPPVCIAGDGLLLTREVVPCPMVQWRRVRRCVTS